MKNALVSFVFTFLTLILDLPFNFCQIMNKSRTSIPELQLRNDLFDPRYYSPGILPRYNTQDDLTIYFEWRLVSLMRISEKNSEMVLSGTIDLNWNDEFLRWSPKKYGKVSDIVVKGEEIWTPQLSVRNRLDTDLEDDIFEDKLFQVTNTGNVSVSFTEKFSTACFIDPQQFPFDCQECHIILLFNTYSKKKLKVRTKNIQRKLLQDKLYGVWGIDETVIKVKTRKNRPTVEVFVSFHLKRHPNYYVLNIIAPATVLSLLSIAIYFIPDKEGEKITCGMTIFLSFVVFIITLGDSLPETSASISVIGVYFLLLMISSTIITIQSIIGSYRLYRKQYIPEPEVYPKEKSTEIQTASNQNSYPGRSLFGDGSRRISCSRCFDSSCLITSLVLIIVANVIMVYAYNISFCDKSSDGSGPINIDDRATV